MLERGQQAPESTSQQQQPVKPGLKLSKSRLSHRTIQKASVIPMVPATKLSFESRKV
jgi:hypothetical protein